MINKKNKSSVPNTSFPSGYVPNGEKDSTEFGLRIGQAIQYEWFKKDGGNNFFSRWDSFHQRRLYARGEQSVAKYKNEMSVNGDMSYMNIDWSTVKVLPKFVDIMVNGMSDRMYDIGAKAQDAMANEKRNSYQKTIKADMVSREMLEQTQKDFGVNAFNMDPNELPKDDEELSLHMQLKYKPRIELAAQVGINTVLEENRYDEVRRQMAYDQVVLGLHVGKHEYIEGEGIKVKHVDPAEVVHSYTEDPHFRDCFYWGEVKTVHINEVKKLKPSISNEEIEQLVEQSSSFYTENRSSRYFDSNLYNSNTVTLLYFNYKCDKKHKWKKKKVNGGERVIPKEDTFDPPVEMQQDRGFEVIEKIDDVWYEGVLVLGTDKILKWELSRHMVKDESLSNKAASNYVACAPRMYKGVIDSLVKRCMPFADQINLTHYKLQQVGNRIVPDGVFVDADGMAEIDLGNGGTYTPQEALNLYFQTGSVVGRSMTTEGDFNNAKIPIQELGSSSGMSKIQALITRYNHNLTMIRDVTGLNEARDGSMPNENSLVGLQKMAAANSNTATRHVLDAVLSTTKDLAICIINRVSDLVQRDSERESFSRKIGAYNVDILSEISKLHLHDFAIHIELAPDDEQKQHLENNIQGALSKGSIELDDAIDVRAVKNITQANELLKIKKKRREEARQKAEQAKAEQQGQINMQSQQMAAQTAMQKIQAETQSKMELEKAKFDLEIQKMNAEKAAKLELMTAEFQMNMQIKGVDIELQMDKEAAKEDRKDERTKLQATQQSKMIEQRKNNASSINFESGEDSLDGFDLGQFEPR